MNSILITTIIVGGVVLIVMMICVYFLIDGGKIKLGKKHERPEPKPTQPVDPTGDDW